MGENQSMDIGCVIFTKVICDCHGLGCGKSISPILDCGSFLFYGPRHHFSTNMRSMVQPKVPPYMRGSVDLATSVGICYETNSRKDRKYRSMP